MNYMDTEIFITILSTVISTVVSGVLVCVLGDLFNEYFLKPIQDYKGLRAKISCALTFYANLYMNPISESNEEYSKASLELRKLASEVDALIELRPCGNIFIPSKKRLRNASKNLIGLSNNFYSHNPFETMNINATYRQAVYKFLKVKKSNKS